MGLFRRRNDAEDMYRGDAPVSAPGIDGAAPIAYSRADAIADSAAFQQAESPYGPPSNDGPNQAGPPYPAGLHQMPTTLPPTPPPYAQQERVADFFAPWPGPQPGPQVVTGRTLDPATAARIQQQLAGAGRKASKLGCLLIAIPLLGALVAAGFGIYAAVKGADLAQDVIAGASIQAQPAQPNGRNLGVTALGTPVAIATDDASYEITVFGAEQQPGDGWGYDHPGGQATLVVDAQITRTDVGTEPITFHGWNWWVAATDNTSVTGNIISHFEPSLDGPDLVGGQTVRGYVSFDSPMTSGVLFVGPGPSGPALATWHFTASIPRIVAGEVGTPAQGEISRPGFTVTAGEAEIVAADDERVGARPSSGQYLAVPITFTGIQYVDGSIGNVDASQLVFIPADAKTTDEPLEPTFAALDGANSFFPVSADAPTEGVLAFDTASVAGELQLRGGAGQPIISWRIDAG